ncbi:hypothetical protein ABEV74_04185 [Paenibacillus cisolokensis]|uniref:hypothetical protein n=1 Tax=Paenibacillus TaxID=44249 RepID=UPI000721B65F|nr:hypothetical protein [Paenibacillus sp. 32O-W]ALS29931.1 hypothetical protein IJ21_45680 [Paenibacillus sp. 32O-W]
MEWLMAAVAIVMIAGLIATVAIAQSKSNKEENPGYFQHTEKKWLRLSGIYVVGIIAVAVILIVVLNG